MILQSREIIGSYFWLRSSLFLVIADDAGNMLEMNPFAKSFVGTDAFSGKFTDLLVDFRNEITWSQLKKDSNKQHRLSVQRSQAAPVSFYFGFSVLDAGYLIVGEQNLEEMLAYEARFLELNRDMSQLTRSVQKTNAELAEKNRQINLFLGMAAHDMRNPVGILLNYGEFLKEEYGKELGSQGGMFLDEIVRTSEFLLSLLDNLLDVVKIRDGQVNLDLVETDLVDFFSQIIERNAYLAKKKSINIEFNQVVSKAIAAIDPFKMEQVVNNLISNAIKYSNKHTRILVELRREEDTYILSVQDQGVGIPEDMLSKVFDAFGTKSKSGTAGEKSTGLGLVIVKHIVEAHGGAISVQSQVDKGTTFIVKIPKKQKNR